MHVKCLRTFIAIDYILSSKTGVSINLKGFKSYRECSLIIIKLTYKSINGKTIGKFPPDQNLNKKFPWIKQIMGN